jgi:hypothetical protein
VKTPYVQGRYFYKNYFYQLMSQDGTPITSSDYSAAEYVYGDPRLSTSTGFFDALMEGIFGDRVGFDQVQDNPVTPITGYQRFAVKVNGWTFNLPTIFIHVTSFDGVGYVNDVNTASYMPFVLRLVLPRKP